MAADAAAKRFAAKRAEYHVVAELLKRGGFPYLPVTGDGGEVLLKTPQGVILELTVLLPETRGGKETRSFLVPDYTPDKRRFIVCVEFDESESPPIAWVFPSMSCWAYSTDPARNGLRKLNLALKSKQYFHQPLWDYLLGFRNRWELMTDFKYYRRFMNSPEGFEDLEDILLMLLTVDRRDTEDESVPFNPSPSEPADALPN